jgi:hypothetical protein
MFGDIGQELTCLLDRSALGLVNGWKIQPLIVLHGEFGWMVRVSYWP